MMLTLDVANSLMGKHIRWYRYCRHFMSAREFTIGGTESLLNLAKTEQGSSGYPSLADEWMSILEVEELREKSVTLRLLDVDGTPTPLMTEIDKTTGDTLFFDEATGMRVHVVIDAKHSVCHRSYPSSSADIARWMERQHELDNYVTLYNNGVWGDEGLLWIPPLRDKGRIRQTVAMYESLEFQGLVPDVMLPVEFRESVSDREYDAVYKLTDNSMNELFIAWIK